METGTETGMETRGRTQDRNKDGNESNSGGGNGKEDGNGDGNKYGMGADGEEAKKRKKPHKSCRRDVGNEEDLGGTRKTRRQERVRLVAADPHNL